MELVTQGFNYYVGYKMNLYITKDINSLQNPLSKSRFKIVNIINGTVHFSINSIPYITTGPHIICINELDIFNIIQAAEDSIRIIYFHPRIINNKYRFNNIWEGDDLSISEKQDLYYLTPFKANESKLKICPITIEDEVFINKKISLLEYELSMQNNNHWPCRSRSYLFEILFYISNYEIKDTDDLLLCDCSKYTEQVKNITFYIKTHFCEKITLETLSKVFHTNRTTIAENFKNTTGLSIIDYLNKIRISIAATFIRDTTLSVTEIAQRTGFNDTSHFSKVFKKETNYNPTEYRNKYCLLVKKI